MNQIIRKIKKAEIISFDIFDTLLIRPYMCPVDVYEHMGRIYGHLHYRQERIQAERKAHLKHPELDDVTLDMIYEEIDEKLYYLKQKEMDWEEMILRANPETKSIYDHAVAAGKKIIIVSDMYLSAAFLSKVLQKNGYFNWYKIYVSGEYGKTKRHGTLYKLILDEMKVPANKILHIGDHPEADSKIPAQLGIRTVLYKKILTKFLQKNKRISKFSIETKGRLDASIIIAIMAYRWLQGKIGAVPPMNYWESLGFFYAGPLVYGYSRFVEQKAREHQIKNLLFVARDGHTLYKIFNTFNTEIKNSYIYAPRFFNMVCLGDFGRDERNKNSSKQVVSFFMERSIDVQNIVEKNIPKTQDDYYKLIISHKDLFNKLAQESRACFTKYIESKVTEDEKVGLVDLTTTCFSAHHLVTHVIKNPLTSFYVSLFPRPHTERASSFFTWNTRKIRDNRNRDLHLMECLITSPEFPIIGITEDGIPIYNCVTDSYERKRSLMYNSIEAGILSFAECVSNFFSLNDIYLSENTAMRNLDYFISYPTKTDLCRMKELKISMDAANSIYSPLLVAKIPLTKYIISPLITARHLRHYVWRTKFQTVFISIFGFFASSFNKFSHFSSQDVVGEFKRKFTCFGVFMKEKSNRSTTYYFASIPFHKLIREERHIRKTLFGITYYKKQIVPVKSGKQ